MLRLSSKLIIAAIVYMGVLTVVYLAASTGFISSSLMYPLVVMMVVLLIMVINMIRFLDARGRAKTR